MAIDIAYDEPSVKYSKIFAKLNNLYQYKTKKEKLDNFQVFSQL